MHRRITHYCMILVAGGLLFFPNLGTYSLWDVDETHNAECAREMWAAGEWVVPTFNYQLRTDKPVLLYWLMMAAYEWFGVNEFAARFWSAVCGLATMLASYELGRRMFGAASGLLAALVLGTNLMFCVVSRAATPDAVLIFTSVATLAWFYIDFDRGGRSWLIGSGLTTALGFLAKGPVGLLLPLAVIGVFLLWHRRLRVFLDWRWLLGILLFIVVAVPWYVWVGVQTKVAFIEGFFLKHNMQRFQTPFEGHGGSAPWYYLFHPIAFLAGFAPWSAFLGLSIWYGTGWRARAEQITVHELPTQPSKLKTQNSKLKTPYAFLWLWIGVWFLAFSVAQTKLPNYVLPAYPAVAILTGRFLVRWATGVVYPAAVWVGLSLGCLGLMGAGVSIGLLAASGWIDLDALRERAIPSLGPLALIGVVLILAAVGSWVLLRRGRVSHAVATIAIAVLTFTALLAAFGPVAMEAQKPAPLMAQVIVQEQVDPDLRLAVHGSYQPGLVYYTRRPVTLFATDIQVRTLLDGPNQAFVVVSAKSWPDLEAQLVRPTAIVGRYRNLTKRGEWLLVTNTIQ